MTTHELVETYGGGPVGVDTLTAALAEARDAVEDMIEPYLMQRGFVMRTPRGRMAAPKAYERLGKKPPARAPETGEFVWGSDPGDPRFLRPTWSAIFYS